MKTNYLRYSKLQKTRKLINSNHAGYFWYLLCHLTYFFNVVLSFPDFGMLYSRFLAFFANNGHVLTVQ